jgi:hypothetical protein
MDRKPASSPVDANVLSQEELAVLRAIRDTSYGAVEVVLHQARIVQIVKTEKLRLESHPSSP